MNKGIIKSLFKLIIVFTVLSGSIVGYAKEDYSLKRIYTPVNEVNKISSSIKVEKANAVEKEVPKATVNNINVRRNVTSSYSTPSNSININGVLSRQLVKDNGSAFYLDHNANGVYDGVGVPFIDFRNNFNTRKTIIYAHSSMDGSGPFQPLQNYHNNPGYYNAHRYITVNYNGQTYNYLIFSVYVSLANSEEEEGLEYFQNMDYSDSQWANALNRYKSHSEYETGVSVNSNDKIIILQTCSMDPAYYEKYYRYNLLIMGKLV